MALGRAALEDALPRSAHKPLGLPLIGDAVGRDWTDAEAHQFEEGMLEHGAGLSRYQEGVSATAGDRAPGAVLLQCVEDAEHCQSSGLVPPLGRGQSSLGLSVSHSTGHCALQRQIALQIDSNSCCSDHGCTGF